MSAASVSTMVEAKPFDETDGGKQTPTVDSGPHKAPHTGEESGAAPAADDSDTATAAMGVGSDKSNQADGDVAVADADSAAQKTPDAGCVPEAAAAADDSEAGTATVTATAISAGSELDAAEQGSSSETNNPPVPDSKLDPASVAIADKEPSSALTVDKPLDVESIAAKVPTSEDNNTSVGDSIEVESAVKPPSTKEPVLEADKVDKDISSVGKDAPVADDGPIHKPTDEPDTESKDKADGESSVQQVVSATTDVAVESDNTTSEPSAAELESRPKSSDSTANHKADEVLLAQQTTGDIAEKDSSNAGAELGHNASDDAAGVNDEVAEDKEADIDDGKSNGGSEEDENNDTADDVENDPSDDDAADEPEIEKPRVQVYGSTVSGNRTYKKQVKELFTMMEGNEIDFEFICIAADEQAKKYVRRKAMGDMTIPQIYVDGDLKGFFDDAFKANEADELYEWLGLDEDPVDY